MIFHHTVKQMLKIIFCLQKIMNDHRYYNGEPKVNLRRSGSGARKNLLNFYQETPMFGQPAAGQASSFRPWKEAEKSKISPYLKLNGKFHSMSNQSPKVKQIHFFIKI